MLAFTRDDRLPSCIEPQLRSYVGVAIENELARVRNVVCDISVQLQTLLLQLHLQPVAFVAHITDLLFRERCQRFLILLHRHVVVENKHVARTQLAALLDASVDRVQHVATQLQLCKDVLLDSLLLVAHYFQTTPTMWLSKDVSQVSRRFLKRTSVFRITGSLSNADKSSVAALTTLDVDSRVVSNDAYTSLEAFSTSLQLTYPKQHATARISPFRPVSVDGSPTAHPLSWRVRESRARLLQTVENVSALI